MLPAHLQSAIASLTESISAGELQRAADELSGAYRAAKPAPLSGAHRAAYLLTRLPATYAAIAHAFHEFRQRHPALQPESLLDLGAGPGTATLAADEIFVSLKNSTLVEKDVAWQPVATRLIDAVPSAPVCDWRADDVAQGSLPPKDLVVLSYSLNELSRTGKERIVGLGWQAARQALVIVEPGTPLGFANILAARTQLIEMGAHIAAPCPHHLQCPLAAIGDWCHFSVRVQRTAEHRRLKSAELGHEDEKFSYLIAAKTPPKPYPARIVRHPLKHKGHVQLTLCSGPVLARETISKKQGELYKHARDAEWGDIWPPAPE